MSDETETAEATAGAKGKKKAGGGAKAKAGGKANPAGATAGQEKSKVEGQVARLLVRAIWLQEWAAANPEGKPEDRREAWKAARSGAVEQHLKAYRRALNMLGRSGVTITYQPPEKKAGEGSDDDGED